MTILVYKDGRLLIDNEQPLEGVSLDNLAAILSNPKDGDVVKYDEKSGMWIAGEAGGGSSLPSVTSSDNGKVLAVENGAWAAGVQEYWIPLAVSGGSLIVPQDKISEAITAIDNPSFFWVRGADLNTVRFAGHIVNNGVLECLLTKEFMEENGFHGTGKLIIREVSGGGISVEIVPDKFIVTITPTALDYSGTMDKTVAEINAAYEAGMEIWFKTVDATGYSMARANVSLDLAVPDTLGFDCLVESQGYLVKVYTSNTASSSDYYADIYALTPAS